MLIQHKAILARIIEEIAGSLDIPDYIYEDAILRYEDVGEFLADADSELFDFSPKVYPQGSFRLGTVVAPYGHDDEYDIDLVCRLELSKDSTSQAELKKRVGDRLKKRSDLAGILEESRRCWRLNFAVSADEPKFHLDVLPAIPKEYSKIEGIYITDKDLHRWQYSNPIAYCEWFKRQMEVAYEKKRVALAQASVDIEEVPDWKIKTPLQRSIQILKRHRDIHFEGDPDDRPISIIITTLAARAYRNEEDIYEALTSIVERMPTYIENRDGKWWVPNPVESNENFADKWNEHPSRKRAFDQWLQKVARDFADVANAKSEGEGRVLLSQSLNRSPRSIGTTTFSKSASLPVVPPLGDTNHVLVPEQVLTMALNRSVNAKLRGSVHLSEGGKKLWELTDRAVRRGLHLRFKVETNMSGPYSLRWQVANTGSEARSANGLRGGFYNSDSPNVRWEHAGYRGTHWIEAFVIDEYGRCVARTGRRQVRVR